MIKFELRNAYDSFVVFVKSKSKYENSRMNERRLVKLLLLVRMNKLQVKSWIISKDLIKKKIVS